MSSVTSCRRVGKFWGMEHRQCVFPTCFVLVWSGRDDNISDLKEKHFFLRLPADQHRSCSQHGCEIARAENFTTFRRTSISLWLRVRLCRCIMFVCGPYKDIRVTYVWMRRHGAMSVIHGESIGSPWKQHEWERQADCDPAKLCEAS